MLRLKLCCAITSKHSEMLPAQAFEITAAENGHTARRWHIHIQGIALHMWECAASLVSLFRVGPNVPTLGLQCGQSCAQFRGQTGFLFACQWTGRQANPAAWRSLKVKLLVGELRTAQCSWDGKANGGYCLSMGASHARRSRSTTRWRPVFFPPAFGWWARYFRIVASKVFMAWTVSCLRQSDNELVLYVPFLFGENGS